MFIVAALMYLVLIVVIIWGIIGYFRNIKLLFQGNNPMVRLAGIFIPPLGAVYGWMD